MSKTIAFIHIHDQPGLLEADLSAVKTLGELFDALAAAGVKLDAETLVFLDEADDCLAGERHEPIHGIKHGCRIHVGRCKRVKVTVNYLEKSDHHNFPPGARLRAVKEWAVHQFKLSPADATEHLLQLCKSTERPASDTSLQQLLSGHHCNGHACELCFDLVPDKRVEG